VIGGELDVLVGFGLTILAGLITGIICMWSVIRVKKGEKNEKGLDN